VLRYGVGDPDGTELFPDRPGAAPKVGRWGVLVCGVRVGCGVDRATLFLSLHSAT